MHTNATRRYRDEIILAVKPIYTVSQKTVPTYFVLCVCQYKPIPIKIRTHGGTGINAQQNCIISAHFT